MLERMAKGWESVDTSTFLTRFRFLTTLAGSRPKLPLDLAPRMLYTGCIRAPFVKGGAVMASGRPNIRGLHPVDSAGVAPR